jgi:hypothetical protein
MKQVIDSFVRRVTGPVHCPSTLTLFPALVFGWFLLNALLCWPFHEQLWGPESVLRRYGAPSTLIQNQIYGLIYHPGRFTWIFFPHVLASALGMTDRRWSFIPRTVAWITGLMLYYAAIPAFNSGMLIMLLLAFCCIPVHTGTHSPWRHALNHFARYAAVLQVMLCYAFSAYFKLNGSQWLSGDAVYYAVHLERFSTPWITGWIGAHAGFARLLTYLVLGYQVLFPLLIFLRPRRVLIFLSVGLGMHLFIGAAMHLWDFALAMIICYALFLPENVSARILQRMRISAGSPATP